jgi:hypothetical protein
MCLIAGSAYTEDHQRIPTWEELGAAGAPAPQILISKFMDTEVSIGKTDVINLQSPVPIQGVFQNAISSSTLEGSSTLINE